MSGCAKVSTRLFHIGVWISKHGRVADGQSTYQKKTLFRKSSWKNLFSLPRSPPVTLRFALGASSRASSTSAVPLDLGWCWGRWCRGFQELPGCNQLAQAGSPCDERSGIRVDFQLPGLTKLFSWPKLHSSSGTKEVPLTSGIIPIYVSV